MISHFLPRLLLALIGAAFAGSLLNAQERVFKQHTVEDGLPSNEVYGMVFDQNNILYAITDRGIWKYDGYTSRVLGIQNGLKENTNFRIFRTPDNRLLVSSINNYLCEILKDTIKETAISRTVSQNAPVSCFVQRILTQPDGSILLSYNTKGLYQFSNGKAPKRIIGHLEGHETATICIMKDSAGYYWDQLQLSNVKYQGETRLVKDGTRLYLTTGLDDPTNQAQKELFEIGQGEFLFSYCNKVFYFRNDSLIQEASFEKTVGSIYADQDGNFWIGLLQEGGALQFRNKDLLSPPLIHIAGQSVTCIIQDQELDYWFSTSFNGIFQTHSLNLEVYKPPTTDVEDHIIQSLATDGTTLFLGTQRGNVYTLNAGSQGKNALRPLNLLPSERSVRKLFINPDNQLVILKNDVLFTDLRGRPTGMIKLAGYQYEYGDLGNGEYALTKSGNIRIFQNDRLVRSWDKDNIRFWIPEDTLGWDVVKSVRALARDSAGKIWIGTDNIGLLTSQNRKGFRWSTRDSLFSIRIRDIASIGTYVWVSIADHGIAVIRPDSTYLHITAQLGLTTENTDQIFCQSDTIGWAATNEGLFRIRLDSSATRVVRIDEFTTRDGFPSNRINQVLQYQGRIWCATNKGAVALSPDFVKKKITRPAILIDSVFVGEKFETYHAMDTFHVFGAHEDDFLFKFRVVSYRIPHRIYYRYQLIGADQEPVIGQMQEARYQNLRAGYYTFKLEASYSPALENPTVVSHTFQVAKHVYEKTWFKFLMGILVLFVLLGIILFIINDIKQRELQKQRLLEAEKKSLLSQMNPHFIFNSLNSIQHFIVQKDDFQANNYLTNFSSLIRRILDNSRKNLITLNEEISTLVLYLDMEKLRFEEGFEYRIVRDQSIDYAEVMIPPMLIQPFVENAIWHGLMALKAKGMLTLTFTRIDGYYHCVIEDNGIGRERAAQIKTKREPHVSTGLKNIHERIGLMNQMNRKKIDLTLTDLKKPDGSAAGTRVELALPLVWE